MEFLRTKRKKHTSVQPPILVELTMVAQFSGPWKVDDPEEVAAIQARRWHPTTMDFEAVANTPNAGFKLATTVQFVRDVDELIGQIYYQNYKAKIVRPNQNLGRVNLISHGGKGVFALSGQVHTDGSVHLGDGDANPRYDQRIDERTLEWFNTDEVGRTYRTMIREKLHPKAEFWLILCNGACVGKSYIAAQELANTFGRTVRAYADEVWCHPDRSGANNHIQCHGGDAACIMGRNMTSIGENGTQGRGYSCQAKVPEAFAGKHMPAAETISPKNIWE
jgi:hypothetical protein